MSFLLDVILLFIIGFLVEGFNHILVIFLNRLWMHGHSRLFAALAGILTIAIFWSASGSLYLDKITFLGLKGSDWMLNSGLPLGLIRTPTTDVVAVILFALYPAGYILGVMTAENHFKQYQKIMDAFIDTMVPRGGAIPPGAKDLRSAESTMKFIDGMTPAYKEGISLLLVALDSRLLTLILSWKMNRFIKLKSSDQVDYIEDLEASRHMRPVALALRSFLVEGYFTKDDVWAWIKYDGVLRQKFGDQVPWHTNDLKVRAKWFGRVAS